ncbi:MAG: hypothetical protein ACXVEF_13750 [Polyangiales bacterium]
MRAFVSFAAVVVVASATPKAGAEAWDPFPELPAKESLAIAKPLDSAAWNAARTCLAKTSASGATFYAAIVDVTDAAGSKSPTASNGVPWVDALYREWKPNERLDTEKHVLIAVGLANHSVAIHPGNRWTEIGFKTATIKSTIDGSSFAKLARAGDQPQAICALVDAVDAKLVALASEESKTIARLRKEIDDLRKRGGDALPKFRALALSGKWATEEQAKLEKLDDKLESALKMFGDGKIAAASENVSSASETVQLAEAAVDRVAKERASLAAAKIEIDKVLAQIDRGPAHDFGPMKVARAKVDRCARDVEQGESALRTYDPWVATPAPSVCLELARPAVIQAEAQWRFRARTLPIAGGTFLLSALGLVAAMRRRRRSAVGLVAQDLAHTWETTVERSAARLLALERDHVMYFSAARPRWVGESEPLDRRVADAVNRAFLLQSAATDLVARAQKLIENAGPLSVQPLEEATRLLTTETVRFETGEVETRRRVDLPLMRSYEGAASTVLGDLSRAYTEAFEALEAASAAVDRAGDVAEETTKTFDEAIAAIAARSELGLPAAHLATPLRALLAKRADAQSTLSTDPIGGTAKLAAIRDEVRSLAERGKSGNLTIAALESLGDRASSLRKRAESLRAEGLRLDEAGLSLDERLDRSTRRARDARADVANGDEANAEKTLEVVRRAIEDLERDLERTVAARDGVPAAVARLREATRTIAQRMSAARATLEGLAAEHDPEAFREESGNVETLSGLLPEIEADAAGALADHAGQRFLSAASRLDRAADLVRRGEALLEAIAQIDQTISRARNETHERLVELDALVDATKKQTSARGVPRSLAHAVSAELARVEAARERSKGPRPHWLALDRETRELVAQLTTQEQSSREAIRAHARAKAAAEALDRRLRSLSHDVDVEPRDRPHVGEAVSVARTRLDAFLGALAAEDADGPALERAFPKVVQTVSWAAEVFRAELEAIDLAERELAAARHRIMQVRAQSYGEGVVSDVSSAQTHLARAESSASRKDWSAVLTAAEAARAAAETQERLCIDRARTLQEARIAELSRSSTGSSSGSSSSWSSSSSSSSDTSSSSSTSGSGGSSWSSSSDSGGSSW